MAGRCSAAETYRSRPEARKTALPAIQSPGGEQVRDNTTPAFYFCGVARDRPTPVPAAPGQGIGSPPPPSRPRAHRSRLGAEGRIPGMTATPLYDEAVASILAVHAGWGELMRCEPADPVEAIGYWLPMTSREPERQMQAIRLRGEREISPLLREAAGLPPKGRRRSGRVPAG